MPAHPISTEEGLKDAARTTLRELLSVAKRYKRRRDRLDALFLFCERSRKRGKHQQHEPKAEVVWEDPPEMELMLKHRDAYERLGELLEYCHAAMEKAADADDGTGAKALVTLTSNINRLEGQRERHLEAIQEILGQLSRELMAQEAVLTKVVAEGARLAQFAQINNDRIRAALETKGMGAESKANSELQDIIDNLKRRIANGEMIDVGVDAEG